MHPQTRKKMTTIKLTVPRMIDPIAALVNEAREDAGAHPVALVAMDIGITLTGGLAVVETKRSFRNDEKAAIEALLSLPRPRPCRLLWPDGEDRRSDPQGNRPGAGRKRGKPTRRR